MGIVRIRRVMNVKHFEHQWELSELIRRNQEVLKYAAASGEKLINRIRMLVTRSHGWKKWPGPGMQP